jgi:hypothetical protein
VTIFNIYTPTDKYKGGRSDDNASFTQVFLKISHNEIMELLQSPITPLSLQPEIKTLNYNPILMD